jgi:hypothetical protein
MRRIILVVLLVAVGAGCILASAPSARADSSVTLQTSALGKDLGQWLEMYAKWYSVPQNPDHHGNYMFMPLPAGDCANPPICNQWRGQLDVGLKPNQGFMLPLMVWTGWKYLDGSTDPEAPESTFLGADVMFTIDGVPLIYSAYDDHASNVADFLVGAQWYKQPLKVPPEREYAADVYAQGVSLLCPPLAEGEHVVHLVEWVPDWNVGWDNTWNITVAK